MVPVAIAFLVGQLLGPEAEAPLGLGLLAAALALALVAALAHLRLEPVTRPLAAAVAGAALAVPPVPPDGCWLPPSAEPVKRWVVGTLVEPFVPAPESRRLVLEARIDGAEAAPICGRLRLSLREPPAEEPTIGDRVRVHATLRRPADFANPSAYGLVEALARRGTWVVGGAARLAAREPPGEGSAARELDHVRRRIREAIGAVAEEPAAGLLRALVLGEARAVDAAARETFAASGLAHLLAVSGLHVGAVFAAIAFLLVRLLGRSERLLLATDPRALAAAVATIPAALYAALAGGAVPAERAVAFVALAALAAALGRETRAARTLALAAVGLSLAHPAAVRSVSFQLSFAAVGGLLLAAPRREPPALDRRERVRRLLVVSFRLSFAAAVATAPLVAFHFQRVSPIALLVNPLLVPTLAVPSTLVALAGGALALPAPAAGEALLSLAAAGVRALLAAAEIALRLPGAAVRVPTPSLLEVALLYGALALGWMPRRVRVAAALSIAMIATGDVAFWVRERSGRGELRIRFLDVGQGDAALLELPDGRVIVIDGGGMPGSFDVGERVVAPALRARKIGRIDVLVATHGDRDHQGGLHALVRQFAPRELWLPDAAQETRRLAELEAAAVRHGARVRRLAAGATVEEPSGVAIDCLHPPIAFAGDSNDLSLVLRVRHGATSVLFSGDVERAAERRLVSEGVAVPVDAWKVPHHGSTSSSDAALLARLRPRVAVVSAGTGNPYGMPRPEVLRRHRQVGARVLRTDVDGSVLLVGDGRVLRARTTSRGTRRACSLVGALC